MYISIYIVVATHIIHGQLLHMQFEEVQYDTCNATAGSGEYRYGGFCLGNDELQLTIHVNPINIVSFQNNTTYYLTSM